jgi:hypothetical protein
MPLLVGLLDASAVRRSLDIPLGVDGIPACSDIDLDEFAAQQSAGGGMLNSIANMANSILGAGTYSTLPPSSVQVDDPIPLRHYWYASLHVSSFQGTEHLAPQVYPMP